MTSPVAGFEAGRYSTDLWTIKEVVNSFDESKMFDEVRNTVSIIKDCNFIKLLGKTNAKSKPIVPNYSFFCPPVTMLF